VINEEFKRRLTGRVANVLVDRLEQTNNEILANDDLDRLRRLHADGQISIQTLLRGLQTVQTNATLPEKMHADANAEIDWISDKFHINLVKDVDTIATSDTVTKDTSGTDKLQYLSANVILPASINIDSLPSTNWKRVTGDELAYFFGQIGPVDGILRTVPETTVCHFHLLPWYEKVALIRITDPTWKDKDLVIYYLTFNGNLYRLNGTSPPIHEVNSKSPIKLTEDNAADYLRFFCFFVRGDEGPFYILEDIDDPFIPAFESPYAQEKLKNNIQPITYEGKNSQDCFIFHATVFYSDALFKGEFAIRLNGMIEMLNDTPLAGELTGRINAPITLS
jgi:hypothetical protein